MKSKFEKAEKIKMSLVEVEKMLNILRMRKAKGYSQYELSFLLGQRDFYVRDIENIAHTLDYKINFSNILRQIFNCEFSDFIPNTNVKPSYTIDIFQHTDKSGHITYKAEKRFEDGIVTEIATFGTEDKKLLLASASSITEEEVNSWVLSKYEEGYFDTEKTALKILKDCEAELKQAVRPLYLANVMRSFNKDNDQPRINEKKDENKRFVYFKGK